MSASRTHPRARACRRRVTAIAAALWVALGPRPGAAQTAPGPTSNRPGDTVLVTPAPRYRAGLLRRWVLGDGHRDLWSTPVPAEVLDLDRFHGGVDAVRLGGGQQTRSLRLRAGDGTEYNFRSLDKDARLTLDPVLRQTLAASVLQDRVSAIFPLGPLVVDPLLEAAGVLHAQPRLVILPDHPRLGEFRADFAGVLGWLEVRPDEGEGELEWLGGATVVVGSPRFLERIEEEPGTRVDAAAFLRARLLDLLVGDWDRHPDQWRWAGFPEPGGMVFRPIPRDRDWALAHMDGLINRLTWVSWPHVVGFGREYPSVFRLTWSGRALDRRLLSELDWGEWEVVVADLEERLDDEVLRRSVARLPETHRSRVGAELFDALRHRRDTLGEAARRFYELLAGWVDVTATDQDEAAEITFGSAGTLSVAIGPVGGAPTFRRSFDPGETREVRIDLRGGDDRARVSGAGGPIVVRVIGGGGGDEMTDATGGGRVGLYDDDDDTRFGVGERTRVDTRRWDTPPDRSSSTHQSGARDWGSRWIPIPALGFEPDVGFYLGGAAQYTSYGFRHYPFRSRLRLEAGIGMGEGRPRAALAWDLPLVRERLRGDLSLAYEGAEAPRFHGFGNETLADRGDAFYEAARSRLVAGAGVRLLPRRGASLRVGSSLVVVRPDRTGATLANSAPPYGHSDFERVALEGALAWQTGGDPADRGLSGSLALGGYLAPRALDVTSAYGGVSFEARARAGLGGRLDPVIVARAGGRRVSGRYPLFDAATLGGSGTLRGYRTGRFTGDAVLFAGAEGRIFLSEFMLLLPVDFGLLALSDVGRVFYRGERSEVWHAGWGAGVWVSFVDAFAVSLTRARGSDGAVWYLGAGLPF